VASTSEDLRRRDPSHSAPVGGAYRGATHIAGLWGYAQGGMIICPRCASKRVVLLTFPDGESIPRQVVPRPIARCADCGHRLTPQEITSQEKPSLN
jgi:DNA-directed RNA polymerase subunit RPC12/RpoP